MSTTHSAEFKAKVALEAVSRSNEVVSEIASKYEVSEEEVRTWAAELKDQAVSVFSSTPAQVTDVEIESDDDTFVHSVEYGVQDDSLDYKKLYLWSGIGTAAVVVFVVVLIFFSQYAMDSAQENAGDTSTYNALIKLTEDQEAILNSYGVVDAEDGVYRIPIDKAIESMTTE